MSLCCLALAAGLSAFTFFEVWCHRRAAESLGMAVLSAGAMMQMLAQLGQA